MDNLSREETAIGRFKSIMMSLVGILLFLVPIPVEQDGQEQTTLLVVFSIDVLKDVLGGVMPFLIVTIITLSGVITLICSVILRDKLKSDGLTNNAFSVRIGWLISRILAVVSAQIIFLRIGSKVIYSDETGGLLFSSLLSVLVAVFLFVALSLPLLVEYGLLEMLGPIFRSVMRLLFTLPGRSTVDNLALFIGGGTVGVLITSKQYSEGYYPRRETTVILTTFSVVPITLVIVVAEIVHIQNQFFTFYLSVVVSCLVAVVVMPRIWSLNKISDGYAKEVPESARTEALSEGKAALRHGFDIAAEVGTRAPGVIDFFKSGLKTVIDMWFVVLPVVTSIGTITTIIVNYTPFLVILGKPFVPFLELMQIPEAAQVFQTVTIGFVDMFLPSILIEGVQNDITRLAIGTLSISQLIYLSEVDGVTLGLKISASIGKLFMTFLTRTITTLPVISLTAHLLL